MPRPSRRLVGIVLALVALAGAVLAYAQLSPLKLAVLRPDSGVTIKVFGLGTVEARVLSKIGFKIAGTLTDLRADHGDTVKAGQVLALIDASEQQTRVAKGKALLASADASVQVAEAALKKAEALHIQKSQVNRRRQSLLERQSASQESADDAQANEAVAQADILVARSEIESARAKRDDARAQHDTDSVVLSQHELRAPFDATVVSRAKELGSVLAAGEALFTLVAPETVWILAYLDESRAGGIEVGQAAEVRLRSLPQQMFRGRVARIGIESDRVNEERRIYVTCDDCPRDFFLGEQAEVFITKTWLERALMVPETLINRLDGSAGTIWIVDRARLRRVRAVLGHRSLDGRVEVSGLPDGALVPVETSTAFREGRSVSVGDERHE
jgi:HlyD family secretion protein